MRQVLIGILLLCSTSAAGTRAIDRGPALSAWRADHGHGWTARADEFGGVELIYGGRAVLAPTAVAPLADEDWIALAERAIDASRAIHGIDVATLVPERALLLPLGQVGSGDKWSVRFTQAWNGIPVANASVSVLFDASGALVALQTHALSGFDGIALAPHISAEAAIDSAVAAFAKYAGRPATQFSEPALRIALLEQDGARHGFLAWQIDVQADASGGEPEGFLYSVDAARGHVVTRERSVHSFDISGTISTMATPGTLPDTAANPPVAQGAKYLRIQNGTVDVVTDANGNFNIPGINTPQTVTLTYAGPFTTVEDNGGPGYSQVVTLNPGPGNAVMLNPAPTEFITSQANLLQNVAVVRDYVRRINPTDATADTLFHSDANRPLPCFAGAASSSISFSAQSANCVNMAYSTIIAHEVGHGLNNRYGTTNNPDGIGEGNADVFAMYAYDTPITGEDVLLSGGDGRNGNNPRQFCGDCSPGCYGEEHLDGEVWMGAAWKVRAQLNIALGNTLGDLTADQLFMGWMNGFDQQRIHSVIELQWLILDDNDANLANGTPHATQIGNGFRAQGFPGLEISNVTDVPAQSCEQGGYPISADVRAPFGNNVESVTLTYRVDGGPALNVLMTNVSGTTWTGNLPYVASPATVTFDVNAIDDGGNTRSAFCTPRNLFVGFVPFYSQDFETGDAGWTHGPTGTGGSPNANDWQRTVPLGRSGTSLNVPWADPSAAVSGTRVFGNDLFLNGSYLPNMHAALTSPSLDCTGRTNVQLRFRRWLTVEEGHYDQARVLVNGTPVWENPFHGHLLDTAWSLQEIDISAIADNNPSVVITFDIATNGGVELGGWNVDDVELGSLVSVLPCAVTTSFCSGDGSLATPCPCNHRGASGRGCPNSVNPLGALLSTTGAPNPDTLALVASGMPSIASASSIFLQGDAITATGIVFGDGLRCIDGALVRLGAKALLGGQSTYPEAGDASVSVRGGVVPGSGVSRVYQTYYRNAATSFCPPATFNVTNAVRVIW